MKTAPISVDREVSDEPMMEVTTTTSEASASASALASTSASTLVGTEDNAKAHVNGHDDDDDDDDEEDEDYVPPAENDEDDDEDGDGNNNRIGNEQTKVERLSASQKRAVDEAYEELFGTERQRLRSRLATTPSPMVSSSSSSSSPLSSKSPLVLEKLRRNKRRRVLRDLFGKQEASVLMATAAFVVAHDLRNGRRRRQRQRQCQRPLPQLTATTAVVDDSNSSTSTHAATDRATAVAPHPSARSHTGLDEALAGLEGGPQKLSTVAKSHADWDTFKKTELAETSGILDDDLERKAQSNQAYLQRQDFLQRVDQRTFEHERTERERKRAASAAASLK